jgi:predicted unusual protein kinase regulating ubiquinone biosynthesis (AarF/ABC1/UbiB family)
MFKLFQNIYFLLNASCIILFELFLFKVFNNFDTFVDRITHKLAHINILYVKIFQAFALNNSLIDDKTNNKLLKFTDNAPWSSDDLDPCTLIKLEDEHNLIFKDGFEPINSGMISLVFKGYKRKNNIENYSESDIVIIKIKRKNIEQKLDDAIEKLLFFIYFLSFIPIVNKYHIPETINKNISIIRQQTNFFTEIDNMAKIKYNCRNLKYVKIPTADAAITKKYPNVIVMEYINGMPINKILEDDYEAFAKQVLKFGLVTTLIHGVSHGDLHSGNVLFIKDEAVENEKYKYKIGVLDFGIIYEVNTEFKQSLLEFASEMLSTPVEELAKKVLNTGLIEPLEIIQNLPKNHYDNIVKIIGDILQETIHKSKSANQLKIYHFLTTFHSYMSKNELLELGLRPSDHFVKTQLALAMSHGITLTLCKDDYINLTDQVLNELFHTKLLNLSAI